MKVKIGKPKNFIGVYQLAGILRFVGVPKTFCDNIASKLGDTKLNDFFQWLDTKRKRKCVVKYHYYDTWSLDETLSHIILPGLIQLKESSHSYGIVDAKDTPKLITDEKERWDWVLEELIWTFTQLTNPDSEDSFFHYNNDDIWAATIDREGLDKHRNRISEGLRLFGKYYQALWD